MAANPELEGYVQTNHSFKRSKPSSKNKWKFYWLCLVQGSLYYYKHAQDVEPAGCILLQEYTLVKDPTISNPPTPHSFGLQKDSDVIVIVAEAQEDLKKWTETLENSFFLIGIGGLEPAPPPTKVKAKKDSMLLRAKKNVAGKAATSALGNKVLLDRLPTELADSINLFSSAIEKRDGKAKSHEIHNSLTKLVLKSWLQIDQKNLKEEDFFPITRELGEVFELMIRFNDDYKNITPDVSAKIFTKANTMIKTSGQKLVSMLTPYLKPKNVTKFSQCFSYLSDPNFLPDLWNTQDIRENELYHLCNVYKKCAPRDVRKKRKVYKEFFPKTLKTPRG